MVYYLQFSYDVVSRPVHQAHKHTFNSLSFHLLHETPQ